MECFRLGEMKHYSYKSQERSVCSKTFLVDCLLRYSEGEPQMIFLQAPKGDDLTIGIGGPLAYIQYTQASGDPPYLAARGESSSWHEFLEFDAGGTATEIPIALCIPLERAIEIAVCFFEHGHIPDDIEWVQQ